MIIYLFVICLFVAFSDCADLRCPGLTSYECVIIVIFYLSMTIFDSIYTVHQHANLMYILYKYGGKVSIN